MAATIRGAVTVAVRISAILAAMGDDRASRATAEQVKERTMDFRNADVFTFQFPAVFLHLHRFRFSAADQHTGRAAVIAASGGFFAATTSDSDGSDGHLS